MYKYFIIFLVQLLVLSTVIAQTNNFAPIGAIWHYNVNGPCGSSGAPNDFYTIESVSDTVLNNLNCRILEYRNSSDSFLINKYVYEDSNIVYAFYDSLFFPIYNFSNTLSTGDSMLLGDCAATAPFFVDSFAIVNKVIDTVFIEYYNALVFKHVEQALHYIEKIGAIDVLIPDWCNAFLGCPSYLRCYADSAIFYKNRLNFSDVLDCEYRSIQSLNLFVQAEFFINPNPLSAGEYLNFYIGSVDTDGCPYQQNRPYLRAHLYNMNGQLIQNHTLPSDDATYMLSTEGMSAGTYILQILDENGRILGTEKVVIR